MFKKQENSPLAEYDYANDYVSPVNFILHKKTSDVIVPDITIRNNVFETNSSSTALNYLKFIS